MRKIFCSRSGSYFLLAFTFCFSPILSAQDPELTGPLPHEMAVCSNSQFNAIRLQERFNDSRVPEECRKKVEIAYRICGSLFLERTMKLSGDLDNRKATALLGLLQSYSNKYGATIPGCLNSKNEVTTTCQAIHSGLKLARENNSKDRMEALRGLPQDQSRPAKEAEIYRLYNGIANDLTVQYDATGVFWDSAMVALENKISCYQLHIDFIRKVTRKVQIAIVTGEDIGSALPQGELVGQSSNGNSSDEALEGSVKHGLETSAGRAAFNSKYGPSIRKYIREVAGDSRVVNKGAQFVFSPAVTPFKFLFPLVVTYLSSAGPAGHVCDTIYNDPLKADVARCPFGAIEIVDP